MKIIFVCTGNTCRSPMAEGIYNHITNSKDASSAAVFPTRPKEANEYSVKAMEKYGVDISAHLSHQLSNNDIRRCDKIYTMTARQKQTLIPYCPGKVATLGEMCGYGDIDDPYGQEYEMYEKTAEEIYGCIISGLSTLQYADKDDAAAIAQLEHDIFPDEYHIDTLRQYISCNNILTAKIGDRIIGYCIVMQAADEGEILRIAVDEQMRGYGVAKKMLGYCISKMKSSGAAKIFLEVRESNAAARSLYEKSGFKQTDIRKEYYRDNRENAIIYSLEFTEEE